MTRNKNRHPPVNIGTSKLVQVTDANRNVIDQTTLNYYDDLREGSRALCRAIMRAGKWHRAMTAQEELQAIEYAHGVKVRSR